MSECVYIFQDWMYDKKVNTCVICNAKKYGTEKSNYKFHETINTSRYSPSHLHLDPLGLNVFLFLDEMQKRTMQTKQFTTRRRITKYGE